MWTNYISDLRNLLSDGPTDKYAYRKKVFNPIDGVNQAFKTFEWRRVTDFTTAGAPLGVYVDDALVTTSADDTALGEFSLQAAPANGTVVTATYYYQWFLDSEITQFMISATNWVGLGDDPLNIPQGLRPGALHYGAQEAYQKLALRWSQRVSEIYLLEDAPADTHKPVQTYLELSKYMREKALELRNDFYQGQGTQLKPNTVSLLGRVNAVMPRR